MDRRHNIGYNQHFVSDTSTATKWFNQETFGSLCCSYYRGVTESDLLLAQPIIPKGEHNGVVDAVSSEQSSTGYWTVVA